MIYRHYDLTELAGVGLGAAVGAMAGWMFGTGAGYVSWVVAMLAVYFLGLAPIVLAMEHQRGLLCGLGAAVYRIVRSVAWSVTGVAVLAALALIVAMPLAAVFVNPVGEWLQERFPNTTNALIEGLLLAVTVAVLGLLVKTRIGAVVLIFAFEGIGKGEFVFVPLTWLFFIAVPTYPIALLIVWLIGWPDGWIGGLLGLTMGAAIGGFHGYRSAGDVSIEAGLE